MCTRGPLPYRTGLRFGGADSVRVLVLRIPCDVQGQAAMMSPPTAFETKTTKYISNKIFPKKPIPRAGG